MLIGSVLRAELKLPSLTVDKFDGRRQHCTYESRRAGRFCIFLAPGAQPYRSCLEAYVTNFDGKILRNDENFQFYLSNLFNRSSCMLF